MHKILESGMAVLYLAALFCLLLFMLVVDLVKTKMLVTPPE